MQANSARAGYHDRQTQGKTGIIIVESMADMAVSPPLLRKRGHLNDHKEACLLSTAVYVQSLCLTSP